jgi:hypothetical protein
MAAKKQHRWPRCPVTGKRRFRANTDAVRQTRVSSSAVHRARVDGVTTTHRSTYAYLCPHCDGWHVATVRESTRAA